MVVAVQAVAIVGVRAAGEHAEPTVGQVEVDERLGPLGKEVGVRGVRQVGHGVVQRREGERSVGVRR